MEQYIKLNITLTLKGTIEGDWKLPEDVFYTKEADYKSICLFYYNTLMELGFDVRAYLVMDLVPRETTDLKIIFSKEKRIQRDIEKAYSKVNPATTLTAYEVDVPADIFYYYPPQYSNAVLLITVSEERRWIYSTGVDWIDPNVYSPERTCSHYMKDGCYYSLFTQLERIIEGQDIDRNDILWDVFFSEEIIY